MKFLALMALLSAAVYANSNDLSHRPKSFSFDKGQAVFVDFKEAIYDINYDITKKSTTVKATISFDAPEAGFPVFDSVQVPTRVMLDGKDVGSIELKTPSQETILRVAGAKINTGAHNLVIEVPLDTLVQYTADGVKSAFWTSDLDDRQFLERYLPANFEFDQVKMTFNISHKGAKRAQRIYSNGSISEKSDVTTIRFPEHFTSSSIFYHNVPAGTFSETSFSYRSVDGRELPVVIYVGSIFGAENTLDALKKKTITILDELEKDYGPFLHSSVTIYNAGSGGMEYCGATMTDSRALGHELFHSYFARGVMPANGNSGWLDEALASWRDSGYTMSESLSGTSKMSSHPYYTRSTDRAAYSFGARFMSYMDFKLNEKGGLKPFLRSMVEKRHFRPIFVEDFYKEMESFYGRAFELDFKRYTYGSSSLKNMSEENPYHKKMSIAELQKFL